MDKETKILIWAVLENIITIICFTILAIIFKHWWVILFSAVFINNIKIKKEDEEANNEG